MKKKIIISIIILVIASAGGYFAWQYLFQPTTISDPNVQPAPVDLVSDITGFGGGITSQTRFSGVVEPQQTLNVEKDDSKKISEILVAIGDTVSMGDVLFTYDTDDIQLTLDQAKLDVESTENRINSLKGQITDLERERSNAPDSEKLGYTLQIQSLELDIRTEEYNIGTKKAEIENIQKGLENTSVFSEIDGTVIDVNPEGGYDNSGNPNPFIKILSTGNFRVKGTISELNINNISPGAAVIVRSRIDEEQVWNGIIENVEIDNPNSGGNNFMGYYPESNSGESATKYNFYVGLNSFDNLILGQHVFVELDMSNSTVKEGMWLPEFYITFDGDNAKVWVSPDSTTLEYREIQIGDYDQMDGTYEIISGLDPDEYIAFPQENYYVGMPAIINEYGAVFPPVGGGGNIGFPEGDLVDPEGGGDVLEGDGVIPEGDIVIPEGDIVVEEGAAVTQIIPKG